MLVNAKRWQIVSEDFRVVDLFDDSDRSIFKAVQSYNHHFLQLKQNMTHSMVFRPRGHNNFALHPT